MPIDFSRPETLKFYTEVFDKERELGAHWFTKNKEDIMKGCVFAKPEKGWVEKDIDNLKQEAGMNMLSTLYKDTFGNRRRHFGADGEILGLKHMDLFSQHRNLDKEVYDMIAEEHQKSHPGEGLERHGVMKPVDPNVTKVLHGSIPEEGRLKYMDIRVKSCPDKKFYFTECTSWDYGWRPEEQDIPPLPQIYGKRAVITNAFSKSNAVVHDPDHYNPPFATPNKCDT